MNSNPDTKQVPLRIPKKLITPIFYTKKKHRIFEGGRNGAKSESIARALILLSTKYIGNILCTRSVQLTIKDSTHRLFSRLIEKMGLSDCFDVRKNGITCLINGNEFIFRGCNALSDPKSEGAKGLDEVRFCWVEEAHTITDRDIEILLPSVRAKNSIFFWSFNSNRRPCPVSNYFEKHSQAEFTSIHYYENPYLTEEQRREAVELARINFQKYREVYLGEPSTDTTRNVLILKWINASIELFKQEQERAKYEEENNIPEDKRTDKNFDGQVVYGLDVADEGADSNALAKRQGNALFDIKERATGDTAQTTEWAVSIMLQDIGSLNFDRVGVGAGVKAELRKSFPEIKTTPHSNGDAVKHKLRQWEKTGIKNKDMFLNFGSQHWFKIRTMFQNSFKKLHGLKYEGDYITINPDIELLLKLKTQLLQIEFESNSKGQIKIIKSPEGTVSPNLADAFMICFRKPKVRAGVIG